MVSPGQPARGAPPSGAGGRPEGLAVTRRGPALPPQPPGKSPLTPPPPSSPQSRGASETTERGASRARFCFRLPLEARAGRPAGGAGSRLHEAGISVPSSLWPEGGRIRVGGPRGTFRMSGGTSFGPSGPAKFRLFPSTGFGRFGETPVR